MWWGNIVVLPLGSRVSIAHIHSGEFEVLNQFWLTSLLPSFLPLWRSFLFSPSTATAQTTNKNVECQNVAEGIPSSLNALDIFIWPFIFPLLIIFSLFFCFRSNSKLFYLLAKLFNASEATVAYDRLRMIWLSVAHGNFSPLTLLRLQRWRWTAWNVV